MQLDQEPAIIVRKPDAATPPTPQDNQLMSKHRVLSLEPQLRFEWRGQDRQSEIEEPDHSASLGDSITSSTRIRFSVHTRSRVRAEVRERRPRFDEVNDEDIPRRLWARSATTALRVPATAPCQGMKNSANANLGLYRFTSWPARTIVMIVCRGRA
jgi:hypothetical protein